MTEDLRPYLLIHPAAQMLWRFRENDFQRRLHLRLKQMAAVLHAVALADHHVSVNFRPTVIIRRDVSDEREHFDLFVDTNLLVILLRSVKVTQRRTLECADGREVAGRELLFLRKRE